MLLGVLTRVAVFLGSLAIASLAVFALCQALPGDVSSVILGANATPDAVAGLRRTLGLDRPFLLRYAEWIGGVLRGDFGVSYLTRQPVATMIGQRLAVTAWLVTFAMLLAVVVAVPLGMVAALRHRRLSGAVVSALSQLGLAVPAFWAGIVISLVFAVTLRWLPANGYVPLLRDPGQWAAHLVLPVVALAVVQGSVLTRYVRSAVLEVLAEDYQRTARAIGWTRWGALVRHGLRNASISVVTVLGLQLATVLVGAIVVESVFALPGLGSLLLDAVAQRDLVLVQGTVMLLVLAVLVVNAVVDLSYLALDPRLRVPGGAR